MFCSTECMNKDFKPNCLCCVTPKLINHCIQIAGGLKELNKLINSEGNEKKTVFDFDLSRADDPSYDKNRLIAICSFTQSNGTDFLTKETLTDVPWIDVAPRTAEDSDFLLRFANRINRISGMNAIFIVERLLPENEPTCGVAMLPFSSLISHSCFSNTHQVSIDNKLILIAKHPIKAGDQIFINYRGTEFFNLDRNERREELSQLYQFVCDCQPCVDDWKADRLIKKDDILHRFMNILYSNPRIPDAIKEVCDYIENNYGNWPSEELHMLMQLHLHYLSQLETVIFNPRTE